MAVTQNSYIVGAASGGYGGSTAGPYPYSFPLIADTDVSVIVDGVLKSLTTHYTHDSSNSRITFVSGQEPSNGNKVIVYRDTDEDPINATFNAGSTIRAVELNDNFKQVLYIAQETENQALSTLGGSMSVNLDMGIGTKINFEGATENAYDTTLTVVDPTADRTITLPNVTGTVITTGDTGTITATMLAANSVDSSELIDGSVDLSHMSVNSVDSDQYVDGSIDSAHIGNDQIDSQHYAAGSIDNEHLAANSVDSDQYVDGSIDHVHLAADIIDGDNIQDDVINSEHIAAGAIDLEHMSANSVDSDQYVDGSIDNVHIANLTITGSKLVNGTINTDQIAENAVTAIGLADNAVDQNAIASDAINGNKIQDNAINSEHITAGSVDLAHLSANSVDSSKIVDDSIVNADIKSDAAISQSKVALDAELVTLAGMPSTTASILATTSPALTSTTTELNILDGKSFVTSISGSSTDVQIPSAKSVNDQILAITQAQGGFWPIDDELKFPNTNPDPNNDAGTIVSIADAGGIVVNGSGVSTTGRTLGGATVTINGIDSTLRNTTIAAGKGMLVQTTSTLNTYTYHRLVVDEGGVAAAQTLVTDFNQRYQVAGSEPSNQPDGTALAEGDLWFDTNANTMKVYEGSQYNVVTSVGDYKLLTVVPDGATSGSPVFNGSNVSFDLRDGSNAASATSAGQLLVSLNGVLQKPNAGSYSASEEGFYLEGSNGIKFCTAPPSGSSIFVTLIGSATSVNVPATNSVVEAAIQTNVVSEGKLKITNSPSAGKFLQTDGSGNMSWQDATTPVLTTRGDILTRNASTESRLAIGTNGQTLQSDGTDLVWADSAAGATGGNSGANKVFWENEQTVTHDYTITAARNAGSFGPITINNGVTVTIPNNSNWTIL